MHTTCRRTYSPTHAPSWSDTISASNTLTTYPTHSSPTRRLCASANYIHFISQYQICGIKPSMSVFSSTEADLLRLVDNYDIARSEVAGRHDNGMNLFGFGFIERILVMRYGNIQAADAHSEALTKLWCRERAELNNDFEFFGGVSSGEQNRGDTWTWFFSLPLSVCLCLSLSVSVCLSLSLSVSLCLSVSLLSICLSVSLSLCLSVSLSRCLAVSLSMSILLRVFVTVTPDTFYPRTFTF